MATRFPHARRERRRSVWRAQLTSATIGLALLGQAGAGDGAPAKPARGTARPGRESVLDLSGLMRRLVPLPRDPFPLLRDARAQLRHTAGAERMLLLRVIGLLESVSAKAEPDLAQVTSKTVRLLRDWAALRPHDVALQRMVAATLFTLGTSYGTDSPGPALRAEGMRRYQRATKRFPRDFASHHGLAFAIYYGRGDALAGLTAARRCLALNPKHEPCRKLRDLLLNAYQSPFCEPADVPQDLQVLHGWTEQRAVPNGVATRPLQIGTSTLYVDRRAVFGRADLSRIIQTRVTVSRRGRQTSGDAIQLEIDAPASQGKLALFRAWAPQLERAILARGERVIAVSENSPLGPDDRLSFLGPIEAVCQRVQRRTASRSLKR